MPTVIHRHRGAWQLCSPASGQRQQHARTLSGVDRADVEQLIREELRLVGQESVAAALRVFSVTPDGWRPDTLGAAIRQARKQAGMTGDAVAAKIGCNGARYREYEGDRVEPGAGRLFAIADTLGVSADALRPFTHRAGSAPAGDSSARPSAQQRPRKPARPRPSAKIRPTRKTRTARP